MKKNISQDYKSKQLLSSLKAHLLNNGEKLHQSRLKLMSLFILALCKVQTVSFHKLAIAFDSPSQAASSLRRIQRFIAGFSLCSDLIARLIFSLLPKKTGLTLIIDRSNWKFGSQDINIFMLGVAYRGVAFPLLFSLLNKKGNSNSGERIALMQRFIRLFGKDCIDCLTADREFVGKEWMQFLNDNNIKYYIRIRNNFKVYLPRKGREIPVSWLFQSLKIGQIKHYHRIVSIKGQYCYLSASPEKKEGRIELVIIMSYCRDEQALLQYKERWQIECCFKAMKSSGFDIENTHLKDLERVEKLLCLVMIAFVWCYKVGDYLDKEVAAIRIKKHGRRAKSVFKYGLEYIANCLMNQYRNNFKQIIKVLSCT